MVVSDIMQKKFPVLSPDDTLHDALRVLAENDTEGAPVVKSGKIAGVITEYDIINMLNVYTPKINVSSSQHFLLLLVNLEDSGEMSRLREQLYIAMKMKVKECMTSNPITINRDDQIIEAARLIARNKINMIPVVSDSKVVGIITRKDIIHELVALEGNTCRK
jgi:CBS domain-containing protein